MPVSLEAERYVLGAALTGAPFDAISSVLHPEDFSLEAHQRIIHRMQELSERGETINRVTVYHELEKHRQQESVGGLSYLADLDTGGMVAAVNLESWLRIVKDKSLLRQTIIACDALQKRCLMAGDDAVDVLEQAQGVLSKIGDAGRRKVRLRSTEEIKLEIGVNEFFYPNTGKRYVPTPWEPLNEILHGWKPNQLIVIAARPGIGKSAAATQVAMHAAEKGYGVALFSLEMAAQEILVRMACQRSRLNSWKYHEGNFTSDERAEFQRASYEIDQWGRIWIDDTTGCTVPAVASAVRKLRGTNPVHLVIVDYLTLMEAVDRHENRVQEVSSITRGFKKMARDFELPVIVLAQLNRAAMDSGEPQLHHLRESGSIEADSDVVIFLHNKDNKSELVEPVTSVAFLVRKQRNGPIGKRKFNFIRYCTRFEVDNKEEKAAKATAGG